MTAAGRNPQRRTGCRCHSAPSLSVAQAWARGGAKDEEEDRKLRVSGWRRGEPASGRRGCCRAALLLFASPIQGSCAHARTSPKLPSVSIADSIP